MSLSLREMEVLHAVVKTGTMSEAGRQLGISQPAVSQLVGAAERRLGVPLFLRVGNRLQATDEMLELYKELELVSANAESARRLADILDQGAGRLVRVGATPALAMAFVPDAVSELSGRYPRASILLRIQEPSPIKDAVIRRDFDIGIVYAETKTEGLAVEEVCHAPIVCLMRRDHPLVEMPVLGPHHLAEQRLISFSQVSTIGEDLDAIFHDSGVRRNVVVQTGNSYTSSEFVRNGLGIGLVDPFIVGHPLTDDLVVRPFLPVRMLTPRIVYVEGRQLSDPEQQFIANVKRIAAVWIARNAPVWQAGEGVSSLTA